RFFLVSEYIFLWNNGFGKSFGSQNLGDLVLLEKGEQLSRVQGHVQMETLQKQEKIDALNIVSLANSSFWVEAFVDSTGYFQALLPSGTYRVQPNRFYTSPFKSAGFKQNTRRIEYSFMNNFEVVKDSITNLDTITFKVIPRPEKTLSSSILPIEHLTPDDIDNFVTTWKDYFDIPAVSVVLIRDNKVFYDKTMGLKNNLTRELANSNTLFEAASISKAVFGVMVLRLAERGIIDLDKPLYQYLPFPNIKDDQRSKLLTARLILGHQSGLPNWAWGGPGTWEGGGDIELNFEPGSDFGYSGEAFNYLGRVVEHITQKKLQTIYEEEIEGPFGVKDSYFYYTDDQEERFALGHLHQYIQIKGQERIASPASSVSTNAHLFQDFVLGLMNEKNMSAESYGLIYEPYTVLSKEQKLYDPEFSQHVSHGFFVQIRDDGMLIGHGGNNGDYDSKFAYNPQKKYAYIVFTNSNLGDEFIRALEEFLLTKH
ncbi:MAG: serine hydrolase domain-containing protein, partial [Bacteroidota bacterium]